ncbi:NUDIX domain-containing protein [Streptomyces sp. NPDC048172]|uniref:NUDIX domain-containing protein n=1 Tax=Streptomyces sp. NPDC048172 TaxID=3365505 RepID=UPI0037124EC4
MGPQSMEAYHTIRQWIDSGELKPGEKIPSERKLEEMLPVRRTALRQVLARLVSEGLLEVHGRSSYRVAGSVSVKRPAGVEPWKIHGERSLYENRWVNLDLVDVDPPGVERFEHHVVRLQHVSIAAIVDDKDRVLMLWRYRFVPQAFGWELPGGIVDPGEDPMATAAREVEEETGWRPTGPLKRITKFQPMVGMVDSPHEVFIGRGAERIGEPTDAEEAGHVEWVPLSDVRGLMAQGELMGAGTLVGLNYLLANRGQLPPPTDEAA